MKRSRTGSSVEKVPAVPSVVHVQLPLPLVDVLADLKTSFFGLCLTAGQQVFQAMQRQMRHLLDLRENKATMRRQAAHLMAAELGWRRAPRLAHALRPLHDR